MFARLSAKALFLVALAALVFFGIGFLGLALSVSIAPMLGDAAADAIVGVVLLLPVALWALVTALSRPPRPAPAAMPPSGLMGALLAGIAKETPWIAIVGAGLAGAADMFLNRNRNKPPK